jgi:hypothetical protein
MKFSQVIQPAESLSESDFDEIAEEEDEYEDGASPRYPGYEDDIPARYQAYDDEAAVKYPRGISKMAEVANRKMRKLKSNLSQKKSDITRSLSKIKKADRTPYSDGYIVPSKLKIMFLMSFLEKARQDLNCPISISQENNLVFYRR